MMYGLMCIPFWVKMLIAIGFFAFCAFAYLVNQYLGGEVR